jgi:hypothetical protein
MEMLRKSGFKHWHVIRLVVASGLLMTGANAGAENVHVPNPSFESPGTDSVIPAVDSWRKLPKPAWYDEGQNGPWEQLVGVFKNTDPTSNDHIPNMNGEQALYLFNSPGAGLFQDFLTSTNHEFDQKFQLGKAYTLTVGVIGGGGGMTNGASLLMSVYYLDSASNAVTVASKTIVHTANLFPVTTAFVDISLDVPTVNIADAWARKNIGIKFETTSGFEAAGGYWDLDNVRLKRFEVLPVPNASFELPETDAVIPIVDSWQKYPKPDWYDEAENGPWSQLIGVFKNTEPSSADHIPNMDGDQALFLFNSPGAGIFQDYNSIGGTNTAPSLEFDQKYQVGRSYTLRTGVIGGGGGMPEGASLLIGMFYRNSQSTPGVLLMTVVSTTVVHSTRLFPTTTDLVDIVLEVPVVRASDPWAGKNLGIVLLATSAFDKAGGYWDIDNIRLGMGGSVEFALQYARDGTDLRLSWYSEDGRSYQLQRSEDLSGWSDHGTPLSGLNASLSVVVPAGEIGNAFFRVVELQ